MNARALLKEVRATGLMLAACLAVSNCIAGGTRIPSESMQPTLDPGDIVVVNRLAYGFTVPVAVKQLARWSAPERGDVVIFNAPAQANAEEVLFIKRVVAVEGDVVEVRANRVILNGEPVPVSAGADGVLEHTGQDHRIDTSLPGPLANMEPLRVPAGHVFVMGDNRGNSNDSRAWGAVPLERVRGKALGVALSLDLTHWKGGQLL